MEKKLSRRSAMIGTAATIGAVAVATEASAKQGHMEAALDHLQKASDQLRAATPNKGGHRTKAITLINEAMAEVKAGIRFAAS
ncbi:hypothetical protein [Acuticoccus kandeliae]|uniref:hypothetical protein n=1 Tax=Acuticoccus kandeliae TaxID=2073160 RepID=UPI00196B6245|nr:hypothetical protein [Acuticoccus kandeliae]